MPQVPRQDLLAAAQRLRTGSEGVVGVVDEEGSSSSAVIRGNVAGALIAELPESEVTAITLEFGTVPLAQVLEALRADNWLHARGPRAGALAERIRADVRRAFYCDEDDWKQRVWTRFAEIARRAALGLIGSRGA